MKHVAIVVVNYNSGRYLERCIRSLLRSTVDLEICVIDNHSSDESLQLIESIPTCKHTLQIVRNTNNLGFSSAVNIGANATSSEYLMVLNPDCYVHSHTVEALVEALCIQQDAGMVGALVFNEDGSEQAGCRRNEPTLRRSAVKAMGLSRWLEGVDLRHMPLPKTNTKVDAVSGSAMLFHRRCFEQIGGMDEGFFLHCEDLDICHRMRKDGLGVYFVPTVSLFHRQGVSGSTSDNRVEALKHQGMVRYYSKHYGAASRLNFWLIRCLIWSHFFVKQGIKWVRTLKRRFSLINTYGSTNSLLLDNLPGPDMGDLLLITGANCDVGDYLLERISRSGAQCVAPFRTRPGPSSLDGIHWLSSEYFTKAPTPDLPVFNRWVNLAPIWTVEQFYPFLNETFPDKVIAISSTSIEVKADSSDGYENHTVSMLREGERKLHSMVKKHGANYVIFRPTMIYGGPRNRNVNLIKRIIKTLRFFPIVGHGEGNRQPIHADDVAHACELVLPRKFENKTYSIGGAEVLNFREVVERTFDSLGLPRRFVSVSNSIATLALRVVKWIPGFRGISYGLIARLSKDQIFSNREAMDDFGFSPRKFEP